MKSVVPTHVVGHKTQQRPPRGNTNKGKERCMGASTMTMKFAQTILEKMGSLFQRYHLRIIEQQNDYLKLQSDSLLVTIVYNPLEKSNTLWIGRNDEKADKIEVDNKVLNFFFKSSLRLTEVSVDVFIHNLTLFFENEASSLLIGDLYKLEELERFDLKRSQDYTQNVLNRQYIEAADKAWIDSNYKEFIKNVDRLNKDKLPSSYILKYKIASRK